MKIETRFGNGDKAWTSVGGEAREVTIGQVRVEVTETQGINGGHVERYAPHISFDNYAPKKDYVEEYMAVETGIGSGNVYKLGTNIFANKEEAEIAIRLATKP